MKKKGFKRIRIGTIVIVVITLCVGIYQYFTIRYACMEVRCIIFPLLNRRTAVEISENTKTAFLAQYTVPRLLLRIEKRSHLSSKDAEMLTKITVMRMQGQFETARSPYPGILSDAITCDKKFDIQPKEIHNGPDSMLIFTGYLNNRKQYGSCLDSEIEYTGLNAIVYCETHKSWYRIEALIPNDATDTIPSISKELQNISCQ